MQWSPLVALVLLTFSAAAQTYRAEAANDLFHRTLRLHANHTYELRDRGNSCWLWSDESGTWSEAGGVVTLRALVLDVENLTDVQGTMTGDRKEIHVEVRDTQKRPLANAVITLNDSLSKPTDERGLAIFERSALEDPLESLHAVYEKTSINSRVEDADDTFHVTLDLNARLRQRIQVIELRRAGETLVEQREDGFTYRRIPDDMAGEDE